VQALSRRLVEGNRRTTRAVQIEPADGDSDVDEARAKSEQNHMLSLSKSEKDWWRISLVAPVLGILRGRAARAGLLKQRRDQLL
jgi:hypothetical protein